MISTSEPLTGVKLVGGSQEQFLEVLALEEFARPALQPCGTRDQNAGPGCNIQGCTRPLLHQQHRLAARSQPTNVLAEQGVRQLGCQVGGGLVEDQHPRVEHQHACDGEHLALPAAELVRATLEHRRERGEDVDDLVHPASESDAEGSR